MPPALADVGGIFPSVDASGGASVGDALLDGGSIGSFVPFNDQGENDAASLFELAEPTGTSTSEPFLVDLDRPGIRFRGEAVSGSVSVQSIIDDLSANEFAMKPISDDLERQPAAELIGVAEAGDSGRSD